MPNPSGFAILLIAAFVLSFGLSYWQHRAYSKSVREMAVEFDQPGLRLVSGRGKGFLRGAAVILVVDMRRRQIVAARRMVGSTVFARFRADNEMVGPLGTVTQRISDKHVDKAVEQAVGLLAGNSGTPSRRGILGAARGATRR